jgi:hypothetical protein
MAAHPPVDGFAAAAAPSPNEKLSPVAAAAAAGAEAKEKAFAGHSRTSLTDAQCSWGCPVLAPSRPPPAWRRR